MECLSAPNVPSGLIDFIESIQISCESDTNFYENFLKNRILIPDTSKYKHSTAYTQTIVEYKLKSCWSFPILSNKGEISGILTVYTKKNREPLTVDINLIEDLVQLMSIAIEHWTNYTELFKNQKQIEEYTERLEKKVEERTKELSLIISELVTSNNNLEDQIETVKYLEKETKAKSALLTKLAENFPNGGISILDTDLRCILVGGLELPYIGISKENTLGKTIDELEYLSKDRRDFYKNNAIKTLNGKSLSIEFKRDGYTYNVNTIPLIDGSKIEHALFVYNNITAQKKVEMDIRNNLRKEKELGEMKSNFISLASHEFRIPLSIIMTSATLIEKQNGKCEQEKRLKNLNRIRLNVNNLISILDDFLSLGKLQEGKLTVIPAEFEVLSFTKDIIQEFLANKKERQSLGLISKSKELNIYQDKKLFRNILLNLISNAIKYAYDDGKITCSIKLIDDKYFAILVEDQGIGIPDEAFEKIFNRFFRAKNSENIQGTGLGLHIVKQYVEMLQGSINFISKQNIGTIFKVILPIRYS